MPGTVRIREISLLLLLVGCGSATIVGEDGGAGSKGAAGGSGGAVGGVAGTGGAAGATGGIGGAAGATGGIGGAAGATGGIGGATGGIGGAGGLCLAGQTVCTNACATLSSDGANCGSCGHSCQGGTCSSGTCGPVKLATFSVASGIPQGLAVNSTTVFTTIPGSASWALYGVAKTAQNVTPSPILMLPAANNTAYIGATDSLIIFTPFQGGQGGAFPTVYSCNPASCSSSQQTWFSPGNNRWITCDPVAQECFFQLANQTAVQYAKLGTTSQTSLTSFTPVLNIALNGISAAANGSLYSAGTYSTTLAFPVLQRVSEDGTSGVSTLANFTSTVAGTTNSLFGPVIVTTTQVFMEGMVNDGVNEPTVGIMSVQLPLGVGNAAPSFISGTTTQTEQGFVNYWADDNGIVFASPAEQFVSCPTTGCGGTPHVLADASQAESSLVGDAQAIYWINEIVDPNTGTVTSAALMKVAR